MEEKNVTKKLIINLIVVSILIIFVISVSFLFFFNRQKERTAAPINTGTISMTYKSSANGIMLQKVQPVSDLVGKESRLEGTFFDFTVTSSMKGATSVSYEVTAVKDKSSTIPNQYIKLYLEKQHSGTYSNATDPLVFKPLKKKTIIGSPSGSMVLAKETISEDTIDNYRLRIWISEDAPAFDSTATYAVRINVYGKAK